MVANVEQRVDEQLIRVPPQDLPAEQAVLGCCLLGGEALVEVVGQLREEHFYKTAHRTLLALMAEMQQKGEGVDELTLGDRLRTAGKLEEVGGREYLHLLASSVPSAANLPRYIGIVGKHAMSRTAISAFTCGLRELDDSMSPDEVVAKSIVRLEDTRRHTSNGEYLTLAQILLAPPPETMPLPIASLQDATAGLEEEEYVLIGGGPGSGKTTLCMQLLVDAAKRGERSVIWSHDINVQKAIRWAWAGMEHRTVADVIEDPVSFERFAKLPIEVYPGEFTLPALLDSLRTKAAEGVQWFLLDYLEKVKTPNQKPDSKWAKDGIVSDALKDELRGKRVRSLVIQRSTKVDGREPRMQDIAGDGSILNDVDSIWYLQRSKRVREAGTRGEATKLWVLKNRHGEVPRVAELELVGIHHYFRDWEEA